MGQPSKPCFLVQHFLAYAMFDAYLFTVQAHAAGSRRAARAVRPRKIVPTIPSQPNLPPQIPARVQSMAAGTQDPELLELQRAFLDMYSASQQPVSCVIVLVKGLHRDLKSSNLSGQEWPLFVHYRRLSKQMVLSRQ